MSALLDFYSGVRAEFSGWYRNATVAPVTPTDLGVPVYFTADSLVTPVVTARPAGWSVALDGDESHVQLTPLQVEFVFGRYAVPRQTSYAGEGRVVFRPGDDGGAMGTLAGPRATQVNPRALADWLERFDIFVWACDRISPKSAEAQYAAVKALFQLVHAACYRNAHGRVTLSDPRWVEQSAEIQRGAEIQIAGVIRDPQYSVTYDLTTGASASMAYYLDGNVVPEDDR